MRRLGPASVDLRLSLGVRHGYRPVPKEATVEHLINKHEKTSSKTESHRLLKRLKTVDVYLSEGQSSSIRFVLVLIVDASG